MKVSVVIPNWNGAIKLTKHLPSILKVANLNNILELMVVDDASTDNSVEVVNKQFPKVKLIQKQKNSGFGSTVNLGVKNAQGDLVVLLNSDAELDRDFLKYILPHFQDKNIFSVGLNAGGNWSWAKFENGFFWHFQVDDDNSGNLKNHQTLWVSGGSGVFRKTIWDKLGGFDPLYDPFYVEDLDLGYRATKRGFINIWESRAKVEHYREKGVIEENFSKKIITDTAERNQLIFTWKNITSPKMTRSHQRALAKRLLLQPKYWPIFLRAIKNLPQIYKKRQIEKNEAKLSDEKLLSKFSST